MHKGLARTGMALLASLMAALLVAPAASARGEARKAYDEATAAFGLGHYTEAAEKYETAFGLRPDPALLYDAAQAYRLGGNRERALELYRNYVRLYPNGANADEARTQVAALGKAIEAEKAAPVPSPAPVAPPPVPVPALPAPTAPPPSTTVAASLSSAPAAEPAAASRGSHFWLWMAVGAAAVVAGSVALVLATRSDKFPDAGFGSVPGN